MKNYKNFINTLNESITEKQDEYLVPVINYLKRKGNIYIYKYADEFITKKDNITTYGRLYLSIDGKALRFNFDSNGLVSIDLWNDFQFTNDDTICNKPEFTMIISTSIMNVLDKLLKFINGDFSINEDVDVIEKDAESEEEIDNVIKDDIIEDDKTPEVEFKTAPKEDVILKTLTINKNVLNMNIDVFEAIKYYTLQVAFKSSNALIVSGSAGLGKTTEITNTLSEHNIKHESYAGNISSAGLYETLFINRHKLTVFDDCDSVFQGKDALESLNILKPALDTKKERVISRILKTHFDSDGMTDREIQDVYDETGKLPKQYTFYGQIIIITNVNGEDIDEALVSRSLHVDVRLNREEVLKRMKVIMSNLYPNISMQKKEETLEFLDYIISNYPSKFPLNIRTLIHSINIRVSNDFNVNLGGDSVPIWQLLIKQYLVKNIKK